MSELHGMNRVSPYSEAVPCLMQLLLWQRGSVAATVLLTLLAVDAGARRAERTWTRLACCARMVAKELDIVKCDMECECEPSMSGPAQSLLP